MLLWAAFRGMPPSDCLGDDHTATSATGHRVFWCLRLADVNVLMQPDFRSSSEIFLWELGGCRRSRSERGVLPSCLGFPALSTANCSRSENGERKSPFLYSQGLYLGSFPVFFFFSKKPPMRRVQHVFSFRVNYCGLELQD